MLEAENASHAPPRRHRAGPTLIPTRDGDDIGRARRALRAPDHRARRPPARRHDITQRRAAPGLGRALAWWTAHWAASTIPPSTAISTGISPRAGGRCRAPATRARCGAPPADRTSGGGVRRHVAPRLASFRRSAIHGDANDYNVLVDARTQRVAGIVDFGDMVVSQTVNDVAIAMAYVALGKPRSAGGAAARGGRLSRRVPADRRRDRRAVWPDVHAAVRERVHGRRAAGRAAGRRRTSASARRPSAPRCRRCRDPSAAGALRAARRLRSAPVPHAPRIVEWLRAHGDTAPADRPRPEDRGRARPRPQRRQHAGQRATRPTMPPNRSAAACSARCATPAPAIGAGGYDEARLIYAHRPTPTGAVTDERRTVHIGLDLTLPAGTPLHAPLDGVVHGFEDATDAARLRAGDRAAARASRASATRHFYTLYGHLEPRLARGCTSASRSRRASASPPSAPPPTNGDWWPHVHVQVITDMLDVPCNFNGARLPASAQSGRASAPIRT